VGTTATGALGTLDVPAKKGDLRTAKTREHKPTKTVCEKKKHEREGTGEKGEKGPKACKRKTRQDPGNGTRESRIQEGYTGAALKGRKKEEKCGRTSGRRELPYGGARS